MECKECGVELMISDRGKLLFENDDRADMPTRGLLYLQIQMQKPCCVNYDKEVHEERFILTIDERLAAKATGFLYYRHAQRRETKMRRNGASG